MLRLVQIHGDFFFNDFTLLVDFYRNKTGIEQHVHENIQDLIKTVVARSSVETGRLFPGECIEVAADALNGLRNLLGRSLLSAFEKEVFDEVANSIQGRRFVARPHAYP